MLGAGLVAEWVKLSPVPAASHMGGWFVSQLLCSNPVPRSGPEQAAADGPGAWPLAHTRDLEAPGYSLVQPCLLQPFEERTSG